MSVTISSAVKNNLLALQTITSEASKSQNILATGKKVNSALDNATSFFTASSLNSRSNSLTNLLDSVSNGIQTIQAANTGISSITKLVDQLKSTAQQALQSSTAFTSQAKISSSSALGGATAADIRGTTGVAAAGTATSTNAISTLSTYSAASATSANNFPSSLTDTTAATVAGTSTAASYATDLTDGDTITVDDGSGVQTFTYQSSTPGAGEFTSLSDLNTLLSTAGIKVAFDNGGTGGTIQAKATDTSVATVSIGGTGGTALGLAASGNRVAGSSITISDGTNSKTATYDSTGLAAGSFSDVATLNSALSGATVGVTAALGGTGGNKLVLTGAGAANITVSGAGGTALGLNATAYNSTAASVLTVGDGHQQRHLHLRHGRHVGRRVEVQGLRRPQDQARRHHRESDGGRGRVGRRSPAQADRQRQRHHRHDVRHWRDRPRRPRQHRSGSCALDARRQVPELHAPGQHLRRSRHLGHVRRSGGDGGHREVARRPQRQAVLCGHLGHRSTPRAA